MDLDVQTLRMERELKTYGASLHMVTLLAPVCCAGCSSNWDIKTENANRKRGSNP